MKKLLSLYLLFCLSCNTNSSENDDLSNPPPPAISYNIIKVYPHDTSSFTQGLIWYKNSMYEGTGLEGESKLLKTDILNGKKSLKIDLEKNIFGEGITIFKDKIYQLSWKNHKVFVYDINGFKKIQEFNWDFEGWGITHNNQALIISTGSNNLYFVNPETFKIEKVVGVSDHNGPVGNLNELEFINGFVYANIWTSDYIIKINPTTGKVEGKMDLSGILNKSGLQYDPEKIDVLNGIAYDSTKNSMYITGKKWPALFEIKLN